MTTIYDVTAIECPHCGERVIWPQNHQEYFPVIRLCRADLKEFGLHIEALDDEDMARIAEKVSEAVMALGYWDAVKAVLEQL